MSGYGTLLGPGALGNQGLYLALRRPRANPAPAERSGLMLAIHPNARTTPAVRAEIARSGERSGVLAERYGVSTETVRKWRKCVRDEPELLARARPGVQGRLRQAGGPDLVGEPERPARVAPGQADRPVAAAFFCA